MDLLRRKVEGMQSLPLEVYGAIDVAARWAIREAVEAWQEEGWEGRFPDVGEYDYDRICKAMDEHLPADVNLETFQKAYNLLADRANENA